MTETTAANPELLADQVSQLLVQPLEAASVVLSSGPRIFDSSGVLRIPKLTGSSPVNFIGEGQEIPSDANTDFDELVLMPTERKSVKVIERYTRELVRQSVIGIDAMLQNRLVKVVSDQLDQALLTGNGDVRFEQVLRGAGLFLELAQGSLTRGSLFVTVTGTPNRLYVGPEV